MEKKYEKLIKKSSHYLDKEFTVIANLSNASSMLNNTLDNINWVGFYLYDGTKLTLGPFQGNPACTVIPNYRGVCGHVVKTKESIIVPDVHLFEGHIACDSASNSEIVIPIFKDNELFGVLDIDSPIKNRFDENDLINLQKFIHFLETVI
ncbi:MAG: GAF domain-containing protein [bacterium]